LGAKGAVDYHAQGQGLGMDGRQERLAGMNSADNAEMAATILQLNGFQQWNPPQLTFRWETAVAVRQALKTPGENTMDAGAGYYVISAMSKSKPGEHDLSGLTGMASQIRNDARASTTMTITGKANSGSTLQATKLGEGTRGGLPTRFFFSRAAGRSNRSRRRRSCR
jgi:hypothetical protein